MWINIYSYTIIFTQRYWLKIIYEGSLSMSGEWTVVMKMNYSIRRLNMYAHKSNYKYLFYR
jgi:hypothetical protein